MTTTLTLNKVFQHVGDWYLRDKRLICDAGLRRAFPAIPHQGTIRLNLSNRPKKSALRVEVSKDEFGETYWNYGYGMTTTMWGSMDRLIKRHLKGKKKAVYYVTVT